MNFQPIFWGGLIAGTLDILAAFLTAWWRGGIGPVRLLQFISSGILGPEAYTGGAKTAALGLALHFLIATGATVVFYFASRSLLFLIERPVLMGLIYGVTCLPVYELCSLAAFEDPATSCNCFGSHYRRIDDHVLRWLAHRVDCAPVP